MCSCLLRISSLAQLALAVTDLESVLIRGQAPLKSGKKDPYDRTAYWQYAENPKAAFQKLYMYCFSLAKQPYVALSLQERAVALT